MDPLSAVLSLLRPTGHRTAGLNAGKAWAIRFRGGAGRIKCYAVSRGQGWLKVDGALGPVCLRFGDCFVLPTGLGFTLCSDLEMPPTPARDVFADANRGGVAVYAGGGSFYLTCSSFEVETRHADLLLKSLPPLIFIASKGGQATMQWLTQRMMDEAMNSQDGGFLATHHLSQLMLLEALRLFLQQRQPEGVGWFFALADPQLHKAIAKIHSEPGTGCSLQSLADAAGMSRSVFARRFKDAVGETPMAYATRWRMLLAADQLLLGVSTLADIAQTAGYESESAFGTAFRRVMGKPPREYARQEARANRAV